MNDLQKYFFTYVLATAALVLGASPAWAQVSLGAASEFSVLGSTNVTCTAGVVTGDVGVSPGTFTNTNCTIAGEMPPATNADAVQARTAFLNAYAALQSRPCTNTLLSTITGPVTLPPGVYCTDAALTGAGVVTLDGQGNSNAVWIFKIGAALTGTNFSVVMAGGGQPCNVYWVPSAGVTMTTSALKGNILAGGATGSITLTGGTLAGRALANVAVTMTDASVIGCDTLADAFPSCKGKKCHGKDKGHRKCDRDGDHDGDNDGNEHKKCNQGVGNGPEGCDPGNSNQGNPFGSNDERGGKPGDPGRKGGNR